MTFWTILHPLHRVEEQAVSFSNTGSTDFRDTDVQQPKTTATLSFSRSAAFSANSGQFDAGSTTTASSLLPRRPPFLFGLDHHQTVSFSVVSLMAIVPERVQDADLDRLLR
jgi:hypothetical protein